MIPLLIVESATAMPPAGAGPVSIMAFCVAEVPPVSEVKERAATERAGRQYSYCRRHRLASVGSRDHHGSLQTRPLPG